MGPGAGPHCVLEGGGGGEGLSGGREGLGGGWVGGWVLSKKKVRGWVFSIFFDF